MPFASQAQRRWMYALHPRMAARWQKETPPGKLPEHAGAVRRIATRIKNSLTR